MGSVVPVTPAKKRAFVAAPLPPADAPASLELPDFHAIQALYRGEASADQQRRFVEWFNRACMWQQTAYRGGDASRDTDFGLGRQFVAEQFYGAVKTTPKAPHE